MTRKPQRPADTGNDDDSGEPVGNREAVRSPGAHEEAPLGDRGPASGANQEQMDRVTGKPGVTPPAGSGR
jgi:hypothetical protein